MDIVVAQELIKILPSLLWVVFAFTVLYFFYQPIRDELLPKLASFEAGVVKMSFARESMDAAVELAQKNQRWPVVAPEADRERVLRRAQRCARLLADAQVLWVDDCPDNNVNEIRMFRQLKVAIDVATTTEAALELMKTTEYDLVLSDMARGDQTDAGIDFLRQLRVSDNTTPVIFYIGTVNPAKGVPPRAFGLTNRPDELLNLTIDVLERKRA